MKKHAIHTIQLLSKFFIVIFVFLSFNSSAQEIEGWQSKIYDSKDGVLRSFPKGAHQDKNGMIWICNQNGAVKFDGKTFKFVPVIIEGEDSPSRARTNSFVEDKEGNLYLLGQEGLFRLSDKKEVFTSCMSKYKSHYGQDLPEFRVGIFLDGSIFLTSFIGLHEYVLNTGEWIYYDISPTISHENNHHSRKRCDAMLLNSTKDKLVIAGMIAMYIFNIKDRVVDYSFNHTSQKRSTHDLLWRNENQVFAFTYGLGVELIDLQQQKTIWNYNKSKTGLNGKEWLVTLSAEYLTPDKLLSSAYNGSPIIIDKNTLEVEVLSSKDYLSNTYVVLKDDESNLWLFNSDKIQKISLSPFKIFPLDMDKNIPVHKYKVNKDGNYFMMHGLTLGTDFLYNDGNKIVKVRDAAKSYRFEYSATEGVFLHEFDIGVFTKYDDKTLEEVGKFIPKIDLGYLDFKTIGNKYLLLFEDRLEYYENGGTLLRTYNFDKKMSYSTGYQWIDISLIDENEVYLHNHKNLLKIHLDSGIIEVIYSDFDYLLNGIFKNNLGEYIAISENGFDLLDFSSDRKGVKRKQLIEDDNLFSGFQGLTTQDSLLWAVSYNSVQVFNLNSKKIVHELSFGDKAKLGVQIEQDDKNVWVTTSTELIRIKKDIIPTKLHSISLKNVEINNEEIDSNTLFSYKENNIRFDWQIPYYGDYNNLNVYTKLEGLENEWKEVGNNTFKFYSGLNPGDYSLSIKAEAPGAVFIKKDIYSFEIQKPWYNTVWFYAGIALVLLMIGSVIFRYRTQTLVAKSKLNQHIAQLELKAIRAQLNPHFIFNSLNSIKRLIQKEENDVAIDYLQLFSAMIRNVLDLSDKKMVSLVDELEFSEQYLKMEKLRFPEKFDYKISVIHTDALSDVVLPPMILQPHLENAIWHGLMPLKDKKAQLDLSVYTEDDNIIICIDDNGIGRAAAQVINEANKGYKHKSKGLSLTIDRLKLNALAGKMNMKTEFIDKSLDNEPMGTTVKIVINTKNQYQ